MADFSLRIIPTDSLPEYLRQFPAAVGDAIESLHDAEISVKGFSFYTSVASVFSSKIEGEEIELDSYIKHKRFGIEFAPDYTRKIDDLYSGYSFAQENPINQENVREAHRLLARHIVAKNYLGQIRSQNMYVITPDGRIEYVAAAPELVKDELEALLEDINTLSLEILTIAEACYFASMIHLLFVKIHPWNDGNGRSARLLEKWFLSEKWGAKAWYIQSEKYYYEHHAEYYSNIRRIGLEYSELDYSQAIPFLLMLPRALAG